MGIPSLKAFSVSKILPHQPDAQGIISTPISCFFSTIVAFTVNGSLQLPNSPLDRHTKHLCKPKESKNLISSSRFQCSIRKVT